MNRKIELDTSIYCPFGWSEYGDPKCDHDFPPESKKENCEGTVVWWTCSKCGYQKYYEVWN